MTAYSFASFRDGPGGEICRRLGMDIAECQSWLDYKKLGQWNDNLFTEKATAFYDVGSSGERALLLGVLYAAGFASLADELAEGKAWRNMHRAGGDFCDALAACILQKD